MPVNPLLFNNNLTPSKTTPSIDLEDPKPILVGSNTVGKKPTLEQEIEKTVSDLIKKGAFKTNGSKYNSGESEISNVLLQPYKGDTVNTDLLTNPDYEAAKRVTESFSDSALKTTKAFGANASGTLLTGSQDCELPIQTHREIVDIAVLILTNNLELPTYQLKQAKVNLNQT